MPRPGPFAHLVALFVAALVAACGSAGVVERTQYGGVIALKGDRPKAMEQAEKDMDAHCGPGNYHIVRESQVAVGAGAATEWRIEYQCGHGAGGPPDDGPAPGR